VILEGQGLKKGGKGEREEEVREEGRE